MLVEHLEGGVEDLLLAVALDARAGAPEASEAAGPGWYAGSSVLLLARMKRNRFVSSDRTTTRPDETIPFHRKIPRQSRQTYLFSLFLPRCQVY